MLNKPNQVHRAWWREPMVWLVGGLPAAAVVAGITTVMIAFDKPDSLVGEGHVKQGMAVTEASTPGDVRASELGISAELSQAGTRVVVVLKGFVDPLPPTLRLSLFHPTLQDQDVIIVLKHVDGANYSGTSPGLDLGKRKYLLEPEDHAWRVLGEGKLSTTASLMLAARLSHSSTHP